MFACVFGCNDLPANKPVRDIATLFSNAQSLEAIKKAQSVRAYRLSAQDGNDVDRKSISEFRSIVAPTTVPKALNGALQQVLLDPATYLWDEANACSPNYGIRIQFHHNSLQVDILVCFECGFLAIFENEEYTRRQDFTSAARTRLLNIAKEVYPNDQVIQSLD